jgi:hypothetical protein
MMVCGAALPMFLCIMYDIMPHPFALSFFIRLLDHHLSSALLPSQNDSPILLDVTTWLY